MRGGGAWNGPGGRAGAVSRVQDAGSVGIDAEEGAATNVADNVYALASTDAHPRNPGDPEPILDLPASSGFVQGTDGDGKPRIRIAEDGNL